MKLLVTALLVVITIQAIIAFLQISVILQAIAILP